MAPLKLRWDVLPAESPGAHEPAKLPRKRLFRARER